MPPLPEWLPTDVWTLEQFVREAETLHGQQDIYRFVQLVLAGKAYRGSEPFRVRLDPLAGADLNTDRLIAVRDYDSLIGITDDLPFRRSIALYPVPNFQDTLSRPNHLTRLVRYQARII